MNQTIDENGVITETRSLVPRSAGTVDTNEVKALANSYLANKAQGEKSAGLFPADLTPLQATQIARLSLAYGLDPFAGELTVFQGRPWVTLDGRIRQAQKHPAFDGIEDVRPASDEERKAFRCRDEEDLWVATVWRKDRQFPFRAFGRAGGKYEKNFIVRQEDRGPELAQKRALSRALRMAFSLPLPGANEDGGSVGETSTIRVIEHERPPAIRPDQTKAIHTLKGKLGLSDEQYREWLGGVGVDSSVELTEGDAQAVLDMLAAELAEKAAEAPPTYRTGSGVDDSLSRLHENIAADAVAHAGEEPRIFGKPASTAPDAPQPTESQVTANDEPTDLADIAAAQFGGTVTGTAIDAPAPAKLLEDITVLLQQLGIDGADARAEFKIPKGAKLTLGQADAIKAWLEKKRGA